MKTDWVAEWFSAMRDCGEDVSIVYGRVPKATENVPPSWYELPHDHFDGISGFAHLLRDHGSTVDALPTWKGDDRYGFTSAVRGLRAFLPTAGIRKQEWQVAFDYFGPVNTESVGKRMAWHLFTRDQTREIIEKAKSAGVTVNTFLLFHLDAAAANDFTGSSASRRWMVPVNLRGAVTREWEASPQMSFLAVDLQQGHSVNDVQAQITRLKEKGYQWGSWAAFVGSFLLGKKGIRKDIKKREQKKHGWTGIFSNLGAWEVDSDDSWLFCPAVWRVYPIAAGCVTVNGRLALTLQLHDAFGVDQRTTRNLLDRWRNACSPDSSARAAETGKVSVA